MAISRRPKQSEDSTENTNPFENPTAQVFADVDNEDGHREDNSEDRYEEIAKTLAEVQHRLSEAERTNMTLLSNPNWASQNNSNNSYVPVGDPSKIKLPDPALDPDGYADSIQKRNELVYENKRREDAFNSEKQQKIKEKVDGLWSAFADAYPEMADNQKRIDYIAAKIAADARDRGIDVERYMFVTRDKFIQDVASEYVEVFGEPEGEDDDYQEEEVRRRAPPPRRQRAASKSAPRRNTQRRNRSEDDYVDRTGGIFGGNESSGRHFSRDEDDEHNAPSMIDDIHAMQKKTGFF